MKRVALAAALAVATISMPAAAETLDNAKVTELLKVGLGDEAVIAKIKSSEAKYDTSTDALIALKTAGVSSPVIAAMIEASSKQTTAASVALSSDSPDPKVPHPTGIYLLADWLPEPKMQSIDVTTTSQTKTGGFFGYALTGGLASMSFKTIVPRSSARVVSAKNRPTFYFYFDQAQSGGNSAVWNAGTVTSPNEFSLVRFEVKKDQRQAKVGKFNIGGAKAGVMDEDRIPFSYTQVMPGVFEVKPDADLPGGEYGFIVQVSTGGGSGMAGMGAMSSKIFDFSVPVPPVVPKKKR